ncbi:NAD(P)-dependent alcohol dehydrogenase, partial [Mycolicibacterium sp.]|uniref:NAD(P)-dependent alcohol dehydrogenase n=1 Tax=Mycolicibacterium sp. TaxID=2320850 RepID=UPI0025DBBF5D
VLRIPESLPLDAAAPLLCAGITTFSPLKHWKAGPETRVAVIGLGGLGHMAVKLAAAMGAEVTVLSQSLKKMEDGLRLGAKNYYATSDRDTFKNLRNSFDLVLNTVSANLDLGRYLQMVDLDGVFVELGAPENPLVVPPFSIIGMRRSIAGSVIGGIAETQEMLDFCAKHGIASEVEVIQPDYINEAYERVIASDVRYRFVIDTESLRDA